jgi:hypothetical protein
MKKAAESSIDRAYSLLHNLTMKKPMKRAARQGEAISHDEVSRSFYYFDLFPSIPVNQISRSSSTNRAKDSTYDELAADPAMTDTASSFLGQDWTFGFDANTAEQRSVHPTSDSTCQELAADSMRDDETNESYSDMFYSVGVGEWQETIKLLEISGEVSSAAIQPGDLEVLDWTKDEVDSKPAAVMTGEQSRAITD